MFHRDYLGFRDVQLLGQNLRKLVDAARLPFCLFMEGFNDFWREGLAHFVCVLSKEFFHLFHGEIGQGDIILNIEWGDSTERIALDKPHKALEDDTVGTPLIMTIVYATQ